MGQVNMAQVYEVSDAARVLIVFALAVVGFLVFVWMS